MSAFGPEQLGASAWARVAREAAGALAGDGAEEASALVRELLVFGLDGSDYALPVERVREIVRMRELTLVPRTPGWLLGVVTLRGEVVEVVDLRQALGLGRATPDRKSRIIVVHGDADRVTGALVDSVSEVLRVSDHEILPAQGLDLAFVSEVCRRGKEFVSIVDVERALGIGDV